MSPDGTDHDPAAAANAALRRIWLDAISQGGWPRELARRWPMQYPPLQPGRLLFIGFNPSFSQRALAASDDASLQDASDLNDASKVQGRLDAESRWRTGDALYPYFTPFREFMLPWEHIDIFAVRERDQATVQAALHLREGKVWTAFAKEQFMVFEHLLASLRPTGIVVVSALGSVLLSALWRTANRLSPGEHDGRGLLRIGARATPVFFAGMLSGLRAMDRFSRARLIYEVQGAALKGR
ncbi:MAG: hypothetical protein M0Z66_00070 [Thermaerobacter sp.]|nr:hypothetical protein [Thermaerobacter sp.]